MYSTGNSVQCYVAAWMGGEFGGEKMYIYTNVLSCSTVSDSLQPHGIYSPWNSPGQNTGVGNRSLLQEIFPTQESNPGFLHCRWILYQLSYQGSPFFPIVNTKLLHHLHSWLNLGMLNHRYEETWIQRALHGFSTHGASVPLILI